MMTLVAVLALRAWGARPVPSPSLAARLAAEEDVIGLVHWGVNTYTDSEWGRGDEDPAILNPNAFDADQIVKACKAGGLKGLVIVAKHHDGLCLWPSKTTEHTIAKSPFRGGKGDYVREMADACRRAGLKFGVYVSPWDRNNAHYARPEYVKIYHNQVKELLSGGYGPVFEMWFDGANGGEGYYGGAREKRTIGADYYKFAEVFAFVRALQPGICIFAGEDDNSEFRWPGNEMGILGDDSRATIDETGGYVAGVFGNAQHPLHRNSGLAAGTRFRMCEADFPLRDGWFYHESERGHTKSSGYLMKLYLSSVGNGGTMNIGIAPNKAGRLDDEDVLALRDFAEVKRRFFANEVTENGRPFNVVLMREDLAKGEQVDEWEFLADGKRVLQGKSIGYKRIRTLPKPIAPGKCELRILADGGDLQGVSFKRYFVRPELLSAVANATTESGETETVKYIFGSENLGSINKTRKP